MPRPAIIFEFERRLARPISPKLSGQCHRIGQLQLCDQSLDRDQLLDHELHRWRKQVWWRLVESRAPGWTTGGGRWWSTQMLDRPRVLDFVEQPIRRPSFQKRPENSARK